jgi:hypothetical protein
MMQEFQTSSEETGWPRELTGKGVAGAEDDIPEPITVCGSTLLSAVHEKRTLCVTGAATAMVKPVCVAFSIHHSVPTLPCGVAWTAGIPESGISKRITTLVPVCGMTAKPA